MKQVLIASFALASLLIGVSSCQKEDSSDVNQDKIYTVYELFYNKNSDKTVAVTRLRFGSPTGTLLEATDPAGVTFNGDVMPYSSIYSGHAKEYSGLITSGTFAYTNTEGTVFSNSVQASYMDTINFPSDFDTITKAQANTMTWVGNALAANERVELFIGTWTWGQDAAFLALGQGSNNIVMGTNQLDNLAVGGSTAYMDRVYETQATDVTSEGGVVRTRYRCLNKQVQIVP